MAEQVCTGDHDDVVSPAILAEGCRMAIHNKSFDSTPDIVHESDAEGKEILFRTRITQIKRGHIGTEEDFARSLRTTLLVLRLRQSSRVTEQVRKLYREAWGL